MGKFKEIAIRELNDIEEKKLESEINGIIKKENKRKKGK